MPGDFFVVIWSADGKKIRLTVELNATRSIDARGEARAIMDALGDDCGRGRIYFSQTGALVWTRSPGCDVAWAACLPGMQSYELGA
jgi:hypothetical protein